MTWAQEQAEEAILLWDQGDAETNYAKAQHERAVTQAQQQAPPGSSPAAIPFSDPGEAKRQQAHALLDRARSQLATAGEQAADVVGHARDKAPERSWLGQAWETVSQAAGTVINSAASFGNAALHHPGMVAGLAGGAALTTVSAAGVTGSALLDGSGVGVFAGGPLGAVSGLGVATGVGIMGAAMSGLSSEATGDDEVHPVDNDDSDAAEETTRDKAKLSPSQRRSVESFEKLIREHEEKLEAYKQDPDAYDNKGFLKTAPNEEIRQKIIDSRVEKLEKEIQGFRNNIDKVYKGEL